jgi:hypothetical protein
MAGEISQKDIRTPIFVLYKITSLFINVYPDTGCRDFRQFFMEPLIAFHFVIDKGQVIKAAEVGWSDDKDRGYEGCLRIEILSGTAKTPHSVSFRLQG